MRAKLLCRHGKAKGVQCVFEDEAVVGRAAECTLRLQDRSISSRHARLFWNEERGGWFLEDLESLNGTRLAGAEVERPERLGSLDVIDFGGAGEFVFVDLGAVKVDAAEPEDAAVADAVTTGTEVDRELPVLPAALRDTDPREVETTRIDRQPPAVPDPLRGATDEPPPPRARKAVLEFLSGPRAGDRITVPEGESVLGRGRDADLVVEASDVSRRHARFTVAGESVRVRDLESRNHCFLEGERFEAEVEVPDGARLAFGSVETRLRWM